jgi:hypothetical protein
MFSKMEWKLKQFGPYVITGGGYERSPEHMRIAEYSGRLLFFYFSKIRRWKPRGQTETSSGSSVANI